MRYHANISENIVNAAKANDKALVQQIVLDEIVTLIEENPEKLSKALEDSSVNVSSNPSKEELINKSAFALVNISSFKRNISNVLASQMIDRQPARQEFSNSEGGEGGGGGGWIAAIAGAVSSGFAFGSATQNLKSEEAKAKSAMYAKIFGKERKRNWLPIIALTGVLLIGALVVWRVTATKK
jgi:hypothetical protein